MKRAIIIIQTCCIFISCISQRTGDKAEHQVLTVVSDTLIMRRNLLSLDVETYTSLSINKRDSIFFLTKGNQYASALIEKAWLGIGSKPGGNLFSKPLPAKEVSSLLSLMKRDTLFFDKLGHPGIPYYQPTQALKLWLRKAAIRISSKMNKLDDCYYFINPENGLQLIKVDTLKHSATYLSFESGFWEIQDFFFYDFGGDEDIELVIFSKGRRPDKVSVGVDIFSLK